MNIEDAMYNTIHDYKGGSASLAPRLGISEAVLNSKVNPNTTTHHLRLDEASKIMSLTNDYRMLDALARVHGGVFVPLLEQLDIDETLVAILINAGAEHGGLCSLFEQAMADGKIDKKEKSELSDKAYDVQCLMQAIIKMLG